MRRLGFLRGLLVFRICRGRAIYKSLISGRHRTIVLFSIMEIPGCKKAIITSGKGKGPRACLEVPSTKGSLGPYGLG